MKLCSIIWVQIHTQKIKLILPILDHAARKDRVMRGTNKRRQQVIDMNL